MSKPSSALHNVALEETTVQELLTPATIAQFILVYEDLGFDKEYTMEAFFAQCFRLGVVTKERNTKAQRAAAENAKVGKQTADFQKHLEAHPELLRDPQAMQQVMASYGILPKNVIAAANKQAA